MGLLGMKIEKNLKDISKYKKKYKIYLPDKKNFLKVIVWKKVLKISTYKFLYSAF